MTDKIGKHHYLPVYYEMFKDRRETVKKVLEIGTAEGAGLKMFRDFFPNARIYGIEIDPKRVYDLQGLDRIEVLKGDQSNLLDIESSLSYFDDDDIDIIIDDGSHKPEHQIFTCLTLMPTLNENVTYIIEDVADSSADFIFKCLQSYDTQMIKVGNRYDDRLIIVKHKHE